MKRLHFPAAAAFLLAAVMASCATRPVFAQGASAAAKPQPRAAEAQAPAKPLDLTLTPLQHAELDAASQRFWRVQDRANELLGDFMKLCAEAAKTNQWPAVRCNPDTLAVTAESQDKPPLPPPAPVVPQPTQPPPPK